MLTAVQRFYSRPHVSSYIACFLNGVLLALCFAPQGLWPLAFLALTNLAVALRASTTLVHAMLRSFLFGYGFFVAGTWWIANALLVDADRFAWMWPISVFGLSAMLAFWFALLGLLYGLWQRYSPARGAGEAWLRFALLWVAVEYVRSLGIFGFPWNLLGSMAVAVPAVLQTVALVGVYGLSLLLALLFTLPTLWMGDALAPRLRKAVLAVILTLVAGMLFYGGWRLGRPSEMTEQRVRIVQGNIPQSMKWTDQGALQAEQVYSTLTTLPYDAAAPVLIVWPETAVPIPYHSRATWLEPVGKLLPERAMLITGALRIERGAYGRRLFNSLLAIDAKGRVQGIYDKSQLVPFGEFVPLRNLLPLEKITPGSIDFSRGEREITLALQQLPRVRPLICYEVIFPWLSASSGATLRPDLLLNVTNDGWYGNSPGPYQHLAAARLRAVEQGVPLLRAANTGISAVIDPYGRVLASKALDTRGVLDHVIPRSIPMTPYARYGNAILLILGALACIGSRWFRQLQNHK